jgi:hypothetical protein
LRSIWRDNVFFEVLLAVDKAIAEPVRAKGCRYCAGVLDVSNYPRKPRGVEEVGQSFVRLSFCCRGCRKRTTPESVRFLGRKVYTGMVVILAGFEPAVKSLLQLCRQTLSRWRSYWAGVFSFESSFWKARRALFPPGFDAASTPEKVVNIFEHKRLSAEETATPILNFFSPLSRTR